MLVLYNRDWTDDLPGTESGQDSEEVACYYVRRHTDPATGRKPWLLGLTARGTGGPGPTGRRARTLNDEFIPEESSDNYFGVVYTGKGRDLSPAERKKQTHYLLSNRIEVHLPAEGIDARTIQLTLRPAGAEPAVVYDGSRPAGEHRGVGLRETSMRRQGKDTPVRALYLDAVALGYRGDLVLRLTAGGAEGLAAIDETARYFDPADFAFSRTGPDGRRDDQAYLDLVETQVKAFLEDPANAVEGRSLKDHVVYVVPCYGLPRTVTRFYGIAQSAVPDSVRDSGNLVSLCQRLETAYYDVEAVRPPAAAPIRLRGGHGAFQYWVPATNYWTPMVGPTYQPCVHPAAYADYAKSPGSKPPWKPAPHFTPELRAQFGKRFLYICSRIDALDPLMAKHHVDAPEYAQQYLTPGIGQAAGESWDGAAALAGTEDKAGAEELEALGLPGVRETRHYAVRFGSRPEGGYYPGAVDWYVISRNGCTSRTSQVRQALRDGVTVTAGAARAYQGCAHTTTHGWWDARTFYHLLFRGYELGEARMLSTYYCQWVTSFFGDPLYRPDLRHTRADVTAPRVRDAAAIRAAVGQAGGEYYALVAADLDADEANPEMVLASVEYWKQGDATRRTSGNWQHERRPRVVLSGLEGGCTYEYRVVLTDPYRNAFDSAQAFGAMTFATGPPLPPRAPSFELKDPSRFWVGGPERKDRFSTGQGELELTYQAGTAGDCTILKCGELVLRGGAGRGTEFQAAGGRCQTAYQVVPGRTYRFRLRYLDWPVTRELWALAGDGREFLLCADNRTPWRAMELASEARFAQSDRTGFVRDVKAYPTGRVCSSEGSQFGYVFDAAAFDKASGWPPQPATRPR